MPTTNLIYILQLELYDIGKFLRFAYTHLRWWDLQKRSKMIWTKKATLIYMLTILLAISLMAAAFFWLPDTWIIATSLTLWPALPLFIAMSTIIVTPFDRIMKKHLIARARSIMHANETRVTVIGISGSYGKTSTREILATILQEKFNVIRLNENVNTDVGIADFVVRNAVRFEEQCVFIVEMGAYKEGDIRAICDFVKPDYSILTGINESHLERFGSFDKIVRTKFELATSAAKLTAMNFDDENVQKNYQRFKIENVAGVFSYDIDKFRALPDFGGIEFVYEGVTFTTKLLARHNVMLILLAANIAKALGMTMQEIADGVRNINHIPHRLEPIYNKENNVWVIDDSYNGNINGIASGIDVLLRAEGRKIVMTPGLVELGSETRMQHRKIGTLYAEKGVNLVLLIKSRAAEFIIEGMEAHGFSHYRLFKTTEEAHEKLAQIIKPGDTIIFQNDLPDNYF